MNLRTATTALKRLFLRAEGGLTRAAKIIGAATVVVVFAVGVWRWAINDPPIIEERLARLDPGAQEATFESVLGPATLNKRAGDYRSVTFVDKSFFVNTVVDVDNTVILYAVTARRAERPIKFGSVTLGRTRFSETPFGAPDRIGIRVGVHNFYWAEEHYLANPGDYQKAFHVLNDSGFVSDAGLDDLVTLDLATMDEGRSSSYGWYAPDVQDHLPAVAKIRSELVVNTYVKSAPLLQEHWPNAYAVLFPGTRPHNGRGDIFLGPDSNDVRVLSK